MATSFGKSSDISASAKIFFATDIVRSLLPCFTSIELLMPAKFLRTVSVLSDSFIESRNFIIKAFGQSFQRALMVLHNVRQSVIVA